MREVVKWCHGEIWNTNESILIPTGQGKPGRVCHLGCYVVKSQAGDFSVLDARGLHRRYKLLEKPMVKQVPLVHYRDGERFVIGTAEVKPDGTIWSWLNDTDFAKDHGLGLEHGKYSIVEELVLKPEDYRNGG